MVGMGGTSPLTFDTGSTATAGEGVVGRGQAAAVAERQQQTHVTYWA